MWQLLPLAIIPEKFKLLKFTSDNLYVKNVRKEEVATLLCLRSASSLKADCGIKF